MRKILILFLLCGRLFAQDTQNMDGDTSKVAQTGKNRFSIRSGKVYFRGATGTKKEVVSTNNSYVNPSWIPSISLAKVTGLQDSLSKKSNSISPTFTGTVSLPPTTSIGSVSSTELGYIDGLTANAQAQINNKKQLVTSISDLQALNATIADFDGSTWIKKSGNKTSNGGAAAGTIIRVDGSNYWERKVDYVTPEMFGAVGDSLTDDSDAIIAAINNSIGYVFFRNRYGTSKSINVDGTGKKIKLLFQSGSVLYAKSNYVQGSGVSFKGIINLTNFDYAEIDGANINGNKDNLSPSISSWTNYVHGINLYYSKEVNVKNCKITNSASVGIYVSYANSISITNCNIQKSLFHGISFEQSSNVIVRDNYIEGLGNQGTNTSVGGIGIIGIQSNYIKIHNNYIYNVGDTGTKTDDCSNVEWVGNTVKNFGKDGIKFMGYVAGGFKNALISNNYLEGQYYWRTDGSSYIQTIGSSTIIKDNVIVGGTKSTGEENGIKIWGQLADISDVVCTNNKITNAKDGIVGINTNNAIINSNTIVRNDSVNKVGSLVNCNNISNSQIIDNYLSGNTVTTTNQTEGINLINISNVKITGNTILTTRYAIQGSLTNSDYIVVEKNTAKNIGTFAINLTAYSTASIKEISISSNNFSQLSMDIYSAITQLVKTSLTIEKLKFLNNILVGDGANDYNAALNVTGSGTVNDIDVSGTKITGHLGAISGADNAINQSVLSAKSISSEPSTTTGALIYSTANNVISVKGTNGYKANLSLSALTANRNINFQNSDGTIAYIDLAQTFTQAQTFGGSDNTTQFIATSNNKSFGINPANNLLRSSHGWRFDVNQSSSQTQALQIHSNGNFVIQKGGTFADVTSSIFTLNSNNQGFLPPRMTATQASAISSPAEGLMVYVTDTNVTFTVKGWWGYDGATWQKLNN